MIYLVATFIGLAVMVLGLLIVLKTGKKKLENSCSTITSSDGKNEVYCETCSAVVKDKCLKH